MLVIRRPSLDGNVYRDHAYSLDAMGCLLENWGDLLKLADRYCVKELVAFCEAALKRHMYIQTAALILKIASCISRLELKKEILAYITADEGTLRAVKDSRSFESLDRDLVAEVMEAF